MENESNPTTFLVLVSTGKKGKGKGKFKRFDLPATKGDARAEKHLRTGIYLSLENMCMGVGCNGAMHWTREGVELIGVCQRCGRDSLASDKHNSYSPVLIARLLDERVAR